jgi:hypothetical protein
VSNEFIALRDIKDLLLDAVAKREKSSHINPLNRSAAKCFSQADEDGITLEILRRINCLYNGTYIEFGVGNGIENNTLILASLGWKGSWVGGEDLGWNYAPCKKLLYQKNWITLDTIPNIITNALTHLGVNNVDVISLDLDGNDIYFTETILKMGVTPKLFIVEYNAKFIPPVKFQIDYNPGHNWNGTDYFGASLTSFVELFEQYNYRLVCCNSHTGSNAFFIHRDFDCSFGDVPTDIKQLYAGPRYHLINYFSHQPSFDVIEKLFRD